MRTSPLLTAALLPSAAATSIGDRLSRVYTKYYDQPLTAADALAAGFSPEGSPCIPGLGIGYSEGWTDKSLRGSEAAGRRTSAEDKPVILYYTAGGQLSGFSADVFGEVEATPLGAGYFAEIEDGRYRMAVGTRGEGDVCDPGVTFSEPVGDSVVVQPAWGGINEHVPLTVGEAEAQGYYRGSCFDGMGFHYFKDLKSPGGMSWSADALAPVVAMYTAAGDLNAVFFASSDDQNGMFSTHEWEPVPLPNDAMCMNTCDYDACHWDGHDWHMWSTMHWYFKDPEETKCRDFEGQGWGEGAVSCKTTGISCCFE